MKISNIRLERNISVRDMMFAAGVGPLAAVVCDIECGFSDEKRLYFCVEDRFAELLTVDVYDAFLIAALYPAMYYGEPIEIEGNVSKRVYHNICRYVLRLVKNYRPTFHEVPIKVAGFADAEKLSDKLHVGTGFSGGVDSFSTLLDNFYNEEDLDYKVDTLFFFHLGQYGDIQKIQTAERARNRFHITEQFAAEIGVNAVFLDTNLFKYYKPCWEYDAGIFCRIVAVLALQRSLKRYYISNAISYDELVKTNMAAYYNDLAESTDPIIMPLLSPNGLDIVCDGAQYSRSEKIARIVDWPLTQKYLNVCVNTTDSYIEAKNCSSCSKCMRTMMALESIDALSEFAGVFNLKKYRHRAFLYKCEQIVHYHMVYARDNVDFARAHGKRLVPKFVAWPVYFIYKIVWSFLRKIKGIIR